MMGEACAAGNARDGPNQLDAALAMQCDAR